MNALSTPAIALLAAAIAYRQWSTAKQKLRSDLFHKRMEVYVAACTFLDTAFELKSERRLSQLEFMRSVYASGWLFDSEVERYLKADFQGKVASLVRSWNSALAIAPETSDMELMMQRADVKVAVFELHEELKSKLTSYMSVQG